MPDCIICRHPLREHHDQGCHRHGMLRGGCACTYVQQVPLPPSADAVAHRERSDWWDRQARISWGLATEAVDDLDQWYLLMRFQRAARSAEIAHRTHAEALLRPLSPARPVAIETPPYVVVPVDPVFGAPSLMERLRSPAGT